MLETVDSDAASINRNFLRPIIEAIYQSPLAFGLQGGWLHYRTPEVFINISSRQNRSGARTWTVRAQVRSHEGALLTSVVESATLERQMEEDVLIYHFDQQPNTQAESSLIFQAVEAGRYCFSIVLPDKEIVIREVAVGTDDGGA